MVTTYAKVLGVIFLVLGILGFIPLFAPDGMLFGIFMVGPLHNVVHLISGIILLAAGMSENWDLARKVVLTFAVIYGLVTIVGFFQPDAALVFGMPMNLADDILHLAITVTALMFALPQRYPTVR